MPEPVITVENISKSFDKNVIFENCSVSVIQGSVFGLVGLNGSGKTTFIRLLLGLLKPGRGRISVLGHDPWKHDPAYFKKIGVILDHDGFSGNLTAADNILFFAEAKGMGKSTVAAYIEESWKDTFLHSEFFGGRKKVKYFSRGQRMQCAICRAFLSRPELYFLDEPTVALDVDAIDHFYSLVKQARGNGATVLISSHQLSAIEDLCDTVGMLHNKTVAIVKPLSGASGPQPWIVRCDGDELFGRTIESVCGSQAEFREGAWHFGVADAETQIPGIVAALVSEGCKVREVMAESGSLRDRIRHSRNGGIV